MFYISQRDEKDTKSRRCDGRLGLKVKENGDKEEWRYSTVGMGKKAEREPHCLGSVERGGD